MLKSFDTQKSETSTNHETQSLLSEGFQSPKSTSKVSFDDPILRNSKPDDFYFNQARTKFLISQQSFRLSTRPDDFQRKLTLSNQKPEVIKNFKELNDVIPEWLTSRVDFQRSYLRMKRLENADLEAIVSMVPNYRNEDEKRALFMWVKDTEYFKNMPKIIIKEICERLIVIRYKEGEKSKIYSVIKQGAKADCLYIIYKGSVGIYLNSVKIAHNSEGGNFGDLALDKSSLRTADVIAETQVVLFAIKDVDYKNILFNYKNVEKHENCKFLSSVPFFSAWSFIKIQLMSNSLVQLLIKAGETIYEFGDTSHVLYLLKSGKVEIQTYIDLKQKNRWPIGPHVWNIRKVTSKYVYPVKVVSAGDYFGEYEILKEITRETRVVALEDSLCLSLNKNDFDSLFNAKDKEMLLKTSEFSLPSKSELEKALKKKISLRHQKEQVLMEAMQINYLPVDKDSLVDRRSRKLKKWMQSIKMRKNTEDNLIKSRIIKNTTKNKIKRGFTIHFFKDRMAKSTMNLRDKSELSTGFISANSTPQAADGRTTAMTHRAKAVSVHALRKTSENPKVRVLSQAPTPRTDSALGKNNKNPGFQSINTPKNRRLPSKSLVFPKSSSAPSLPELKLIIAEEKL